MTRWNDVNVLMIKLTWQEKDFLEKLLMAELSTDLYSWTSQDIMENLLTKITIENTDE